MNSADLEQQNNLGKFKIDNIEPYERRQNLEFVDVSETNKEDAVDIVLKLCKALGINVEKKIY